MVEECRAFIADKISKKISDFSTEGSIRNIQLAHFANFRFSQQHTSRDRCKNKRRKISQPWSGAIELRYFLRPFNRLRITMGKLGCTAIPN